MFGKIKKLYYMLFPSLESELCKELSGCSTVLDLGCGPNSLLGKTEVPFSVGVELFEPYLKKTKEKEIHNEYIKANIMDVEFDQDSFDAVICIDVLEHLTKKEGQELIKKMEKWAIKKMIIFTTNGFVTQNHVDDNPLQIHKSGWSYDELKALNFNIFGLAGWKFLVGSEAEFKYKPKLIFLGFSVLTRRIYYYLPQLAFEILCVKILSK